MGDRPVDALSDMFRAAREEGRTLLLPYLMVGLPDPASSIELFSAMADAGADGFEVGIPYADPLMDGPLIMAAGQAALRSGITVPVALDLAGRVRSETGKPVVVMTYTNPVLRHGVDHFFSELASRDIAGVIVADLPVDEIAPFREAAIEAGVGIVAFAAPTTTDERLDAVVATDPVFVYAIAEVGVTGERRDRSANTSDLATRIRARSDVPIVFGVGISTPDHAAAAASVGDGVILGTAIVRRVVEATTTEEAKTSLAAFVTDLRTAIDAK
ncbi:MAG: tryptophan synthase subunit alpha [Acidimicrobiia bacterium]|nr:tryptophan synthase subunit alpha [Acidimicrobiia bacterium]